MVKKSNQYNYKVKGGSIGGYFNIYQGKKGHIFLMIGSSYTKLTLEQVNDLSIDVYGLIDFDYELFKDVYIF